MATEGGDGRAETPAAEWRLRPAGPDDLDALAAVFIPSLALLDFLPPLHGPAAQRAFLADAILPSCTVEIALHGSRPAAFLARENEEIRLLYTHPDWLGRGAGSALIASARQAPVAALWLWCFEENARARRFYERRGFRAVERSDGSRNEEGCPDIRYLWRRNAER